MIFPYLFNFHSLQIWDFSRKITVAFLLHFKYERFEKKSDALLLRKNLFYKQPCIFLFLFKETSHFKRITIFLLTLNMIDLRKKNGVVVFHQILFYQELTHNENFSRWNYYFYLLYLKYERFEKKSEALLCFQLHFSLHFKYEIFEKKNDTVKWNEKNEKNSHHFWWLLLLNHYWLLLPAWSDILFQTGIKALSPYMLKLLCKLLYLRLLQM